MVTIYNILKETDNIKTNLNSFMSIAKVTKSKSESSKSSISEESAVKLKI